MGHISVAHIDNCYLQSQTYEQCMGNVIDSIILLDSLGWVAHPIKSIFIPRLHNNIEQKADRYIQCSCNTKIDKYNL